MIGGLLSLHMGLIDTISLGIRKQIAREEEDVPVCCISPPTSFLFLKSQTLIISSEDPVASHLLPPILVPVADWDGEAATALTDATWAGKMKTGFRVGVGGEEAEEEASGAGEEG